MLAPPLQSTIDTGSERFRQNRDDALEQVQVIDELLAQAGAGGPA